MALQARKWPSEENELPKKCGLRIPVDLGFGTDSNFRRNLETAASQTNIAFRRVKASLESAGRNRKFFPSAISSGAVKILTSAGACIRVNATSHIVIDPGFTVANRRHSP